METLLHITTQAEWEKALRTGEYTHPSLESEGFIHCSKASQILWVANRFYRGNSNLILLQIDATKVKHTIKWENSEGGSELFPHIYGSLNTDAVTEVSPFPCAKNGEFLALPEFKSR